MANRRSKKVAEPAPASVALVGYPIIYADLPRSTNIAAETVVRKKELTAQQILKNEAAERKQQLKEEKSYKTISIIRRRDIHGGEDVSLTVLHEKVREILSHLDVKEAHQRIPVIDPMNLVSMVKELSQRERSGWPILKELNKFLLYHTKDVVFACNEMISKGIMQYEYLWHYYAVNTEVYTIDNNQLSAGRVVDVSYEGGWSPKVVVKVEQIQSAGDYFIKKHIAFSQKPFKGTIPLENLQVRLLDDKTREKLIARGKTFEAFGLGNHYLDYVGSAKVPKDYWGYRYIKSDGRIILDYHNYNKRNEDHDRSDDNDNEKMASIPEEYLPLHCPYLRGFSFTLKKWAEFGVETMTPIKFRDDAFETLVLDPEKKKLISALVKNANSGFKDIIDGKSGGCMFLLSGTPGTGKTLTAESLAEKMHKPLYSVSVGELGISPKELEEKLRDILSISEAWDAVILIDEADIFLQARNEHDIVRNAMVGIFLRLLEYHSGVMFLTTNRATNLDQAFHSRISVALHYFPHGVDSRKKIWDNLLKNASISGIDTAKLAKSDINGRQIKTVIRLAQAVARDKNETLGTSHMAETIMIQEQFLKDVASK
jgi:hypothetical protein